MAYGETSGREGLIETLFSQKVESKKEVNTLIKRIKDSGNIKNNISPKEVERFQLHPTLVRSYIFNSEEKFLKYAEQGSCQFYALMEQGLLKSHHKSTEFIPLQDIGGNDILITKADFKKYIYEKRCPKFSKRSDQFSKRNFSETLKSLNLEIPETKKECSQILSKWRVGIDLPFICAIPNKIILGNKSAKILSQSKNLSLSVTSVLNKRVRDSEFYKIRLSTLERQYFASICQGLEDKDLFCTNYTTKDYWALAMNGKAPGEDFHYLCKEYLKVSYEKELTQGQKQRCASSFRKNPETCMNLTNPNYPALFPKNDCISLSKALTNARFRLPFKECTGKIENSHTTTAFRIARQKVKEVMELPLASKSTSCQSQVYSDLYSIYTKSQLADTWPTKICYDDKIEGKAICRPYLPGSLDSSDLSEEKVATSILFRLGKIDKNVFCKISSETEYNPVLIKYKTGCHIITKSYCFHSDCEKKVIIDEKPIKVLNFKGHMAFDYFPQNWQTQRKSFSSLLDQRFNQEQKVLRNFTQLKSFLVSNEKSIVHGLGCIEDLLPSFFSRKAIGQCTTHSFIIDGIIKEMGQQKVIMRSSYDDSRSPRLIPWNQIFNAVMNQQSSHPLRQWNLYGLK